VCQTRPTRASAAGQGTGPTKFKWHCAPTPALWLKRRSCAAQGVGPAAGIGPLRFRIQGGEDDATNDPKGHEILLIPVGTRDTLGPLQGVSIVKIVSKAALALTLALGAIAQDPTAVSNSFTAKNLVSDIAGVGVSTDTHLINPWGLSRLVSSSFSENQWWASDNATGVSTLYDANGTVATGLIVTIPPATGTGPGSPTGTVAVNTVFDFATADGTISAWNANTGPAVAGFVHPQVGGCAGCHTTSATIKVNNSGKGASYSGLTTATSPAVNAGKATLYTANTAGGVEAYDATSFVPVTLPSGAFVDANVPANFVPCGIQAIGSAILVTFAPSGSMTGGAADFFSPAGALLLRLESGAWFSQPFGAVLAPAKFGAFSNAVIIGNTLDGTIMAFNPANGHFLGLLHGSNGKPLAIPGIWGIAFGNGNTESGPTTTLYFNAGIHNFAHGLFGAITSND
jgi:uncharacterized protein (TIGR03118 family)